MDMAPRCRRDLLDQGQGFCILDRLILGEQPRQDGGVVVDDCVRNQLSALVARLDCDIGFADEFLLAADLGDGQGCSTL